MKWLLCGALLVASGMVQAEEFVAKVIAVLDGDTVLIRRAHGVLKIRLADIDAPEVGHTGLGGQPPNSQTSQPFGASSQRSLSDLVLGKQVSVVSQATDQYGRMVAHLSVDGLDVNTEQIRRGMAWEYSFHHSNRELIALESEARQAPRGLWTMSSPTTPWEWRKRHPNTLPRANAASGDLSCGQKKHCSSMSSCEEARHYLAVCGMKYLDADSDGTPCEKLCAPHARKDKPAK